MQPRTVCVWFGLLVWFGLVCWFAGLRNTTKPNHPIPWAQAVAGLLAWFAVSQHRPRYPCWISFLLGSSPIKRNLKSDRGWGASLESLKRTVFGIGCIGCCLASVATDAKNFWLKIDCLYRPTLGPGGERGTDQEKQKIAILRYFFGFRLRYCHRFPLPILSMGRAGLRRTITRKNR